MKCPSCGHENREGAKFCDRCGGKLDLDCGQCGRVNRTGAKFCDACGASLPNLRPNLPLILNSPNPTPLNTWPINTPTTRSAIEGERKLVTVMFADVAGFTATPAILNAIANAFGGRVRSCGLRAAPGLTFGRVGWPYLLSTSQR